MEKGLRSPSLIIPPPPPPSRFTKLRSPIKHYDVVHFETETRPSLDQDMVGTTSRAWWCPVAHLHAADINCVKR